MGSPVIFTATTGTASVTILRPRIDVLLVRTEGHLTSDLWESQIPSYTDTFRTADRIHVYRDASRVRGLTTGYRHQQQQFAKDHSARLVEVVFHQRSTLIALAINAGAIFSRANVVAVSRAEFDRRLCILVGPAMFASMVETDLHGANSGSRSLGDRAPAQRPSVL